MKARRPTVSRVAPNHQTAFEDAWPEAFPDHPVAAEIGRDATVAKLERRLRRLSKAVGAVSRTAFRSYEDTRADIQTRREQLYFAIGYRHGRHSCRLLPRLEKLLAGRAADANRLVKTALGVSLRSEVAVVLLLECANTLLLGKGAGAGGGR